MTAVFGDPLFWQHSQTRPRLLRGHAEFGDPLVWQHSQTYANSSNARQGFGDPLVWQHSQTPYGPVRSLLGFGDPLVWQHSQTKFTARVEWKWFGDPLVWQHSQTPALINNFRVHCTLKRAYFQRFFHRIRWRSRFLFETCPLSENWVGPVLPSDRFRFLFSVVYDAFHHKIAISDGSNLKVKV